MKTVRLQFEVYEDQLPKLEELMRSLGLRRRAELFNQALSMLSWALKEHARGRVIVSMDEASGTRTEFVMYGLWASKLETPEVTPDR